MGNSQIGARLAFENSKKLAQNAGLSLGKAVLSQSFLRFEVALVPGQTSYTFDVLTNDNTQAVNFNTQQKLNLQDSFDLKDYDNCYGKYVFKKRLNSWMPEEIQNSYGSTHILETRLYSWCFSLIDEYIQVIHKNFELFNRGLDTEHSHLINIPPDKLLEYDMVNTGCVLALNGEYMLD